MCKGIAPSYRYGTGNQKAGSNHGVLAHDGVWGSVHGRTRFRRLLAHIAAESLDFLVNRPFSPETATSSKLKECCCRTWSRSTLAFVPAA